jgi:hypothetical protein
MFFMDGTQKKIKLSRKVITHPSFASFFAQNLKYYETIEQIHSMVVKI